MANFFVVGEENASKEIAPTRKKSRINFETFFGQFFRKGAELGIVMRSFAAKAKDGSLRHAMQALVCGLALCGAERGASGAALLTQAIELLPGWNAVCLEVQPAASRPDEVFMGTPVEVAACFLPGSLGEQYVRRLGDAPWREEGWAVWRAPAQTEVFLSNLSDVQAHRAYLIRASAHFTLRITGKPRARMIAWQPDSCTFTGLPVDAVAPPTFQEFFSGSEEHKRLRIFRLEAGRWALVRDPKTARPRSGEAYWIQTDGASAYEGPMRLSLPARGEFDLDGMGSFRALNIFNAAPSTARIRIETAGGAEGLQLQWVERDLTALATRRQTLSAVLELPALRGGAATSVQLAVDRTAMKAESESTLLKISDGRGTVHWVPVSARRSPAATTTAAR